MWSCIRYVSMKGLMKADSEGLIDSLKFCMMNFRCSKSLPKRISVTCSHSAFHCGWRDGWGIGEYSRAKWNKWNVAKRTSLAFLDMGFAYSLELACKNALSNTLFRELQIC